MGIMMRMRSGKVGQCRGEIRRRYRPAIQKALKDVAAEAAQVAGLGVGLDPFGHHRQPQRPPSRRWRSPAPGCRGCCPGR